MYHRSSNCVCVMFLCLCAGVGFHAQAQNQSTSNGPSNAQPGQLVQGPQPGMQVQVPQSGGMVPVTKTGGLVPMRQTGGMVPVQQTGGLVPVQPSGTLVPGPQPRYPNGPQAVSPQNPGQPKTIAKQNGNPRRGAFNGSYYANTSNGVEKWDFLSDGTFIHLGVMPGVMSYLRKQQRGRYEIVGNKLILSDVTEINNFNDTRPRINGSGAQTSTQSQPQHRFEYTVQLVGPQGENGIIINGQKFNIRHGW